MARTKARKMRAGSAEAKASGAKMRRLRSRKNKPAATRKKAANNPRPAVKRRAVTSTSGGGNNMAKRKRGRRRAAPRAAVRARRSYRRSAGAMRGLVPMATQGVVDAGVIVASKAATRAVTAFLKIDGQTTLGSVTEALAGLALGVVAEGMRPGMGRIVVAGAFAGPAERVVRQAGIPYVTPLLGEDYPVELGYVGDPAYLQGYSEGVELGDLGTYGPGSDQGLGLYSDLGGLVSPAY